MTYPRTKANVLAWGEANGVEISYEPANVMSPIHHVHADIVADDTIFRAHGLHTLGLWDDEKAPNWKAIGRELIEADLGQCHIDGCLYCNPGAVS